MNMISIHEHFNNAIAAHAEWKRQLIKIVNSGFKQNVEGVANFHACQLGQWIDGSGSRFESLPSFQSMRAAHEEFHGHSAEIISYSNSGQSAKARELLKPGEKWSKSSAKLFASLMQCSNELADSGFIGTRNRDRIRDILTTKPDQYVVSINADASILEAAKLMVDNHVGSVAVYKNDVFLGIFTERGYLQNMVSKGLDTLKTPVSEVVDAETICVHLDDSVEQCMVLMTNARTRHLPVEHDGKLIGIISIGDIVKKMTSYNNERVLQLERYIHGHYMA